jgi:hypothetical protein
MLITMFVTKLKPTAAIVLLAALVAGLDLRACLAVAGDRRGIGIGPTAQTQLPYPDSARVAAEPPDRWETLKKNEPNNELRLLVEKVLNAYGGEANLRRLTAFEQKMKQTDKQAGGKVTTVTQFIQLPDKMRVESESGAGGKQETSVFVWSRGAHRNTLNGIAVKLTGPEPPAAYWNDFVTYFGPRAALKLKDPTRQLALLGETKVGDCPARGVRLTKDIPGLKLELKLFFDKETGLLLKEENNVPDLEVVYSNYKQFDGVPVPQKTTREVNGKLMTETELVAFRATDKIDAKLFERP